MRWDISQDPSSFRQLLPFYVELEKRQSKDTDNANISVNKSASKREADMYKVVLQKVNCFSVILKRGIQNFSPPIFWLFYSCALSLLFVDIYFFWLSFSFMSLYRVENGTGVGCLGDTELTYAPYGYILWRILWKDSLLFPDFPPIPVFPVTLPCFSPLISFSPLPYSLCVFFCCTLRFKDWTDGETVMNLGLNEQLTLICVHIFYFTNRTLTFILFVQLNTKYNV